MGRHKYIVTDEQRRIVELMKAANKSDDEIRRVIMHPETGRPINVKTLRRKFHHELLNGRAKVSLEMIKTMERRASKDSSPQAAIYFMRHILGIYIPTNAEDADNPKALPSSIEDMSDGQLDGLIKRIQADVARKADSGEKGS